MHDHARVDLFTLTANITMHISVVIDLIMANDSKHISVFTFGSEDIIMCA